MGLFDNKKKGLAPLLQPPQTVAVALPIEQDDYQMSSRPMAPVDTDSLPVADMAPPPLPNVYQDQQNALFNPGPLQQRYQQAAVNGPGPAPKGWKGHLGGILQGLALGGLPGAIVGGIAPGIPQRALFRGVTLPQLAQQADQEMQQQAASRQGYHALAQSTGFDPITHAPTLPMIQAQSLMGNRLFNQQLGLGRLGVQQQRAEDYSRGIDIRQQQGERRLDQGDMRIAQGDRRLDQGDTRIAQGERRLNQADRAQQFREWIGNQNLGLRREYNQILRQKGENHPDVEAFRQMVEEGLVDEQGMADNPKYDLEGTKATFKGMGYSDEEATRAAEGYLARKGIAPKIPVTKLPQYQGRKAAVKARGSKGAAAPTGPRIFPRSLIHDYAVENKMSDADAEAHIKQNGYQIQ